MKKFRHSLQKTFEIQSCLIGFHFSQVSRQPKPGEILNASNKDETSSLLLDRYAIACKDKNGKTVIHVPKYVLRQMNSSLSTVLDQKLK